MPRLNPVSRREFVQRLRSLGFEGPYSGGRHEFMLRGDRRLILPNPHRGNISRDLWFVFCVRLALLGRSGNLLVEPPHT
jgi:hypothetical protein